MSAIELNEREQVIERILHLPDEQVLAVAEFIQSLEDAEDLAIVEARRGEPSISLDDYLKKNNLSREELEAEARAEGWMK